MPDPAFSRVKDSFRLSQKRVVRQLLLSFLVVAGAAFGQNEPRSAGDTPAVAGPLASLSAAMTRSAVGTAMRKVGDWQVARLPSEPQTDWTYAALYPGLLAVPSEVAGTRYQNIVLDLSRKLDFKPGLRVLHADDQAVGQTYLELYERFHDPAMLQPMRARIDEEVATPDDPSQPLWWWCDALFMAPPVYAELARITHDAQYVKAMDHQWDRTSALLYSPQDHLFSRDKTFLDKREANGRPLYWSRGNGWVMAGLVRVIDRLPAGSPDRARYTNQLREMAAAVLPLQGVDGLWRAGLLDRGAYPLPEISGSMFITYALAYGTRHGLLSRATYDPVVRRAWAGALTHIYQDGRLGCIQPVGSSPAAFTETSSYVYGVGAFLLAGSEIYASLAPQKRR